MVESGKWIPVVVVFGSGSPEVVFKSGCSVVEFSSG